MNFLQKYLCFILVALIASTFLVSSLTAQTENKTAIQPRKAGVKRVGILLPIVDLNNVGDKNDPADAVQNTFKALLDSESIEIILLDARLSALALKEALDKECDFLLKISLTQKQQKKGSGFLDRIIDKSADSAVSETTSRIPTGNSIGGTVGRETVVGAGQEVNQIELKIMKKDEFVLDYRLSTPNAKSVAENTIKVKAEKDNDDVLMPLIEKAANEIAEFLLR